MSAFDIPPHSRRASRLALGVLALVAAGSFAAGLLRQPDTAAPAPRPPSDAAGGAIAEARPIAATALQVAPPPPRPRRTPVIAPDQSADPAEVSDGPATAAQTAPSVDAAAVAPDTPPPPPKPAPDSADPPTT